MQQQAFVFSGFGGQGVMFAGQLLAYAAMDAGLEVTWIPSYGPEMRGGTAHCFVVISERPIGSPLVERPQSAVVFNNPSFDKYESVVAPGGWLIVNASLVQRQITREDFQVIEVPATDIADSLGNTRLANMVLLGALLQVNPVLSVATLKQALDGHIPSHRRNLLKLNFAAVDAGAAHCLATV